MNACLYVYTGELCFWWGIFIICSRVMLQQTTTSTGNGGGVGTSGDYNPNMAKYYGILSPLFITSILFGLSGLPLLEKGANK